MCVAMLCHVGPRPLVVTIVVLGGTISPQTTRGTLLHKFSHALSFPSGAPSAQAHMMLRCVVHNLCPFPQSGLVLSISEQVFR